MPLRQAQSRRPAAKTRPLPDYLRSGLDSVIVGINPGLASAAAGHHYAGRSNHFWPLLSEAGFTPEPVTCEDDAGLPAHGIGLTNLVDRPSRGQHELSKAELAAGAARLAEKLRRYRPRVVAFNGKAIAEAFLGRRCELGLQPERWEGLLVYVMPSTSPRGASYQRADKLRFFRELRRIVQREAGAMSRAQRRKERAPPPDLPIFSERLTAILEKLFEGKTPNAGNFCGFCYTPLDKQRLHCPHCQRAVADYPSVDRVPRDVLLMFRSVRRRESLIVNGFAYLGLALGVALFIGVFYVIFSLNAGIWWYIFDIVLLFVAARVLAGLLGGWIGDEVGFRYARNKLADEWRAYEAARAAQRAERTAAQGDVTARRSSMDSV